MFKSYYNNKRISNKVFLSIVKYCVPVLSVGFLIATVRYTAYLECENTYSSEALSRVEIENQRISLAQNLSENDLEVYQFPTFSFNSIEDEVKSIGQVTETTQKVESVTTTITTTEPVKESVSTTNESQIMVEGYGVSVNDEFLGAVSDSSKIQNALNDVLNKYLNEDNVTEAHFNKKIEYTKGSYASDYMLEPETIIKTLLGNVKEDIYYTIEDGDSLSLVSEISDLTIQQILELNPQITNPNVCHTGEKILIQKAEPFLNVEYTKTIINESEIPFETVTQQDSTLIMGESKVITNGENGISKTVTEVKYINGIEVSSTTTEPQVVREPISQVVAIGIAEPISVYQDDIAVINSNVVEILNVGEFISPIENGVGYISDRFISDRNHKGLDIAAPYGTPIRASAEGTVISAGWNSGGYGYFVMIDHGNGYATLYAHMSQVLVSEGQYVYTGETIGEVGSTGNSTGNHVHFEVRYNNVCVNPEDYLIETP